ncbi:DUF3050 domain-containing protein [Cyclobacterium xiamenense]|uniref:DUF3050 domain-containing protein n=1 Tax=Cyclobacterium xiamenense TaxID=1297121 RepID=UPI0012B8E870|nr:DUF3050 domain-containing protein [Cyclobacterium xiamenense]
MLATQSQDQLAELKKKIEPIQQQIVNHRVYAAIRRLEDLNVFMRYHVYAVWDFMSLLKTLQHRLTCTSVPWFPVGNPNTRYLINEIVVGEESDIDADGLRKSHFELYLEAMNKCNADTLGIETFLASLKANQSLEAAYRASSAPKPVRDFVDFTFSVIASQKNHVLAAVFTFGREDLIPAMFLSMVNDIHKDFPDNVSLFKYYLERHIEVDGGHHGQLALEMTATLCGNNPVYWEEAERATIQCLNRRIDLWDEVYDAICR